MASVFTHAFLAVGLGKIYRASMPPRFWILSALCAVLPDADVLTFAFGISYGDMLGHRGLSHSLAFALVLGCAVAFIFFQGDQFRRGLLTIYFFIVTASHGALDALTNGGLGVALFAPLSAERYFFPVRPLVVSPIGIESFFSEWGWAVIRSEVVWVWIPGLAAIATASAIRRMQRSEAS
jgi:inner membrane protein